MKRAAALLALAGCQQPPVFYGLWSIDHARVGDVEQHEVGSFEIADDDTISLVLSYSFAGEFVPDPTPRVVRGSAVREQSGTDEDPVYFLKLEPFGPNPFSIVDYDGASAVLRSPTASWPGDDPFATGPTYELELTLAR